MKILIDGDGCPVVDVTIRVAKKLGIEVLLLCDTAHVFDREGVETIIISKGADSVDFALLNKVDKGDIIVTQDYGLAAMVIAKEGYPINQNGMIYSSDNIDQLLFSRHMSREIRSSGGRVKGPKKRKKEDNIRFEESLIYLIKSCNE